MNEKSTSKTKKTKYLFWCSVPYRVDVTDLSYIHLLFMLRLCYETVFDIMVLTQQNRGDSVFAIIGKDDGEYYIIHRLR